MNERRRRRQGIATLDGHSVPYGPARLVVISGDSSGAVHPVQDRQSIVIGRSLDCDFVIGGTDVSRQHAQLLQSQTGHFLIEDLGSSNGTSVNGHLIESPTPVRFGDQIALGKGCVLLFTHFDSAEEQLLEQQRLELLGRIAAGVAHDLNNLLGAILATKDYLEALPSDETLGAGAVRECLKDIDVATRRATDLTPRLLRFVRGSEAGRKQLDVSAMCRELGQLARRTFDRRILVEDDVAPGLRLMGDEAQIHQILMNLVVNARDAMPEGGRLTIEARLADPDELQARDLPVDRDHILFTVADEGNGMDAETQARIFEPFFTTKKGKGFGLGLATARQLLAAHRGHIEIDSALGLGTTFRIFLPGTGGAPVRATDTDMPAFSERGERWRILLVDDDPSFGKATVRLLRRVGHELELVMSGREALSVVDAFAPEVILLDLDLPDLSGEEVLATLARKRPGTRVVVMSGYAGGSRTQRVRNEYPALPIVSKPASVDEIQSAMRAAIPVGVIRISDKPDRTLVRKRPPWPAR